MSQIPELVAQEIVSSCRDKFVVGHPRSWWLSLAVQVQQISSEEFALSALIPNSNEDVFFIPETETERLPVYSGGILEIEQVLGECPFFEYYVVSKELDWLVIESDHNAYLLYGLSLPRLTTP